jgi:hypothetical protein
MLFSKPLLMTKAIVGVAICVSSVPAMANPCVAGAQGCVLPLRDAVVAQPVIETPVAVAPYVEPVILAEPKGFPILLLLGLAAAAAAAFLLLRDNDDDDDLPISA